MNDSCQTLYATESEVIYVVECVAIVIVIGIGIGIRIESLSLSVRSERGWSQDLAESQHHLKEVLTRNSKVHLSKVLCLYCPGKSLIA